MTWLVGLTLLASGLGVPPPEGPPDRYQPAAVAQTTPVVEGGPLHGRASWYDYVPGGAAAGPALRKMLGKDWRGSKVRVCADGDCVTVTLSDWCQCYKGERRERIIDLDVRSFAALADPGAGLVKVTIP